MQHSSHQIRIWIIDNDKTRQEREVSSRKNDETNDKKKKKKTV